MFWDRDEVSAVGSPTIFQSCYTIFVYRFQKLFARHCLDVPTTHDMATMVCGAQYPTEFPKASQQKFMCISYPKMSTCQSPSTDEMASNSKFTLSIPYWHCFYYTHGTHNTYASDRFGYLVWFFLYFIVFYLCSQTFRFRSEAQLTCVCVYVRLERNRISQVHKILWMLCICIGEEICQPTAVHCGRPDYYRCYFDCQQHIDFDSLPYHADHGTRLTAHTVIGDVKGRCGLKFESFKTPHSFRSDHNFNGEVHVENHRSTQFIWIYV